MSSSLRRTLRGGESSGSRSAALTHRMERPRAAPRVLRGRGPCLPPMGGKTRHARETFYTPYYFFFLPPLPFLPPFFLFALIQSFLFEAHLLSSCLYSMLSIPLVAHTRMSIRCMLASASFFIS